MNRDVKTVNFLEPVTGLPKPVFYGYRKAHCERDNCHLSLVAPRLLSVDRFMVAVARIPDARTPADAAKQRTVAYLSGRGRGNRCFCHHELITIVTPLSRPGSAKTAASVCLYSVYRKQERSLFTAALVQTSNVPTAIVRRRVCGLLYPASGRQSRLSVAHLSKSRRAARRRRDAIADRMLGIGDHRPAVGRWQSAHLMSALTRL